MVVVVTVTVLVMVMVTVKLLAFMRSQIRTSNISPGTAVFSECESIRREGRVHGLEETKMNSKRPNSICLVAAGTLGLWSTSPCGCACSSARMYWSACATCRQRILIGRACRAFGSSSPRHRPSIHMCWMCCSTWGVHLMMQPAQSCP